MATVAYTCLGCFTDVMVFNDALLTCPQCGATQPGEATWNHALVKNRAFMMSDEETRRLAIEKADRAVREAEKLDAVFLDVMKITVKSV